jgi:nucleoside-diphosphate-sugar epimerase
MNMIKILISGGAGYIGSVLARLLLSRGYHVRIIDNLRYGGETIIELMNYKNFEFVKGDIRAKDDLKKALKNIDYVVHLAAIVGDPACAKEPDLARETNYEASKQFYDLANKMGVKRFVYASTCSNYGKMKNSEAYVNETSELAPVSLYAETKVASEKYLLTQSKHNVCKPTCLRFSTVYGLSPRIRFDLTVNEFTKELAMGRELVIFGEQFWRPYCHVYDLARAVMLVLEEPEQKVAFEVFNVGDTKENYQKRMLADEILKFIPDGKVKYIEKNEDPRDYKVSFKKFQEQLGFKITKKVPDGIREIIKVIMDGMLADPDDPKYKNI